jgi:hypothetical protein
MLPFGVPCLSPTQIFNRRRVWRYEKGNQNPYIEEEQKKKQQKDKQRSTKHTHKAKESRRSFHGSNGVSKCIDFVLIGRGNICQNMMDT